MATTHVELFSQAGFKPRKPLVAKSRERLFAELECRIPADLESFYESCNGVRSAKAECRALPLGEAVELIEAYEFIECFSFLPFFESENMVSDPCMYILDGPLRGYIYHHLHDGTSRVLAASISKFARAFKNADSGRLDLEKVEFEYPRSLSQKDKKIVEAVREDDDADSLLRELADGMSKPKKTGWAANYIDENPDFAKFLDRCENCSKEPALKSFATMTAVCSSDRTESTLPGLRYSSGRIRRTLKKTSSSLSDSISTESVSVSRVIRVCPRVW